MTIPMTNQKWPHRTEEELMQALKDIQHQDIDYRDGKAYGMVFNPSEEALNAARKAYAMFLSTNGLDFTQFPSLMALEKDVVGWMLRHLNAPENAAGAFTSGGTESIILALKTARDHYRKIRPEISEPEVILPITAHAAHWKGCHYLGLKPVRVPVNEHDFRVDPDIYRAAITDQTIAIVGSAPSYTHGVIDPIEALGRLAEEKGLWLHVDACMGGFMLPFYRELGEDVPPFDLSVPGVHSISADLHKYGYAPKGASVVLYRDRELRASQWFVGGQWLGYPMVNSTIQSSKTGGAVAAAWTTLQHIGPEGYRQLTRQHIEAAREFTKGLEALDGVELTTPPDFCIFAFDVPGKSIFMVADKMQERGWFVQPILGHDPFKACLHVTINQLNFGCTGDFLKDLEASVAASSAIELEPQMAQMLDMLAGMAPEQISPDFFQMAVQGFGLAGGELPSGGMAEVNEALNRLPYEHRNLFLRYFVNGLF